MHHDNDDDDDDNDDDHDDDHDHHHHQQQQQQQHCSRQGRLYDVSVHDRADRKHEVTDCMKIRPTVCRSCQYTGPLSKTFNNRLTTNNKLQQQQH